MTDAGGDHTTVIRIPVTREQTLHNMLRLTVKAYRSPAPSRDLLLESCITIAEKFLAGEF